MSKYKVDKIHFKTIPCNRPGFRNMMKTSDVKEEVTCKVCLAKLEQGDTGIYPVKLYRKLK